MTILVIFNQENKLIDRLKKFQNFSWIPTFSIDFVYATLKLVNILENKLI